MAAQRSRARSRIIRRQADVVASNSGCQIAAPTRECRPEPLETTPESRRFQATSVMASCFSKSKRATLTRRGPDPRSDQDSSRPLLARGKTVISLFYRASVPVGMLCLRALSTTQAISIGNSILEPSPRPLTAKCTSAVGCFAVLSLSTCRIHYTMSFLGPIRAMFSART